MLNVIEDVLSALDRNETVALATVTRSDVPEAKPGMKLLVRGNGTVLGNLANASFAPRLVGECLSLLHEGKEPCVREYEAGGTAESRAEVFIEIVHDRPTAIIVGAGHIGRHLTKLAKAVGFNVVIVDDRPDFANPALLPDADEVIAGDMAATLGKMKLDDHSYVVLVTRGHQHDEATLRAVVNSGAAYVGMIGSRTRTRTVKERLLRDGFARDRIDAVYAPIGLPIAAETPEEIALSIVAEMVKVRRSGDAESLRDRARR